MGRGRHAVVDGSLKVYEIENLRVANLIAKDLGLGRKSHPRERESYPYGYGDLMRNAFR